MRTKHSLAISLSIAMLASFTILACGDGNTLADSRDGKKYKTVKIDKYVWMAENLNYEAEGSKCYGEGGSVEKGPITITLSPSEAQANCTEYGRLYNWETAMKACPKGWLLPTDADWEMLVFLAGGEEAAGTKLKATSGWRDGGNGTDDYGFSALPGGGGTSAGTFSDVGFDGSGYWWSATEVNSNSAYSHFVSYGYEAVGKLDAGKSSFFSVRCVKN